MHFASIIGCIKIPEAHCSNEGDSNGGDLLHISRRFRQLITSLFLLANVNGVIIIIAVIYHDHVPSVQLEA
jgi:hypothetical protein